MGFSSYSDLLAEISSGKMFKAVFQKRSTNAAASVAGRFHECFSWPGLPGAGAFPGVAGVATAMDSSYAGALPLGSALASEESRHVSGHLALSPTATVVPATLFLVDFLLHYPSLVVTGAPTALNNSVTLPRHTTGEGVVASVFVQTLLGAASPALTFTYIDSNGDSRTGLLTAPAASLPVSTAFLDTAGGPWLPRTANATNRGVRSLTSYTLASGTTGTVVAMLYKVLGAIPIMAINTASERDFVAQLPSLPLVEAQSWGSTPCLGWIMQCGGAMVTSGILAGTVDLVWG